MNNIGIAGVFWGFFLLLVVIHVLGTEPSITLDFSSPLPLNEVQYDTCEDIRYTIEGKRHQGHVCVKDGLVFEFLLSGMDSSQYREKVMPKIDSLLTIDRIKQ